MQSQYTTSSTELGNAKERLKNALTRLEKAIINRSQAFNNERALRTQVIQDLDGHIKNLETILNGEK